MSDTNVTQLTTLWFAAMIFIQTGSGSVDNPLVTAVGLVAVLLAYLLPFVVVARLVQAYSGDWHGGDET